MTPETPSELKHGRLHYLKWIFSQYRERKGLIFVLFLLTVLSTIVSVLFPLGFKYIIDALVQDLKLFKDGKIDMAVAFAHRNRMLVLFFLLGIAGWFRGFYPYLRGRMNTIFERVFRERYFDEILEKGHRFFLHFRTGDLVTRLTEDVKNFPPGLSWLCCSGIFRAVNSSSTIFFCLLSMFFLNVKLTLLSIIPLPILLYIFHTLETTIENRFKKLQQGISETNDFLESAYSGIKIVKSFNAEEPQCDRFGALMQRRIGLETDVIKIEGLFAVYFQFLIHVGQVLVLLFGGIMVIRGTLSIGDYYAFFSYLGMIVFPLIDIPMLLVTLAQSFVAIDRLEEINEVDAEWRDERSGTVPVKDFQSLETRKATFRFREPPKKESDQPKIDDKAPGKPGDPVRPSEPFSLKEIDLKIDRGEKVAVVGRIGTGKTTLLNLVSGILAPDSGQILVNGIPFAELEKRSFRERVGYIQQEPVVFSETVSANIDFWRGSTTDWIGRCAELAQMDEEIKGFPNGFQEKVGQRGVTLSGGQRQRLSVARALAGKPELLLMDDITSSLDAENELQLWSDLKKEFPGVTCLIVTHRLSSAQHADRIILLDDGRIAGQGTHEELMGSNKIYQELANR